MHELRTPLCVVVGRVQLLRRKLRRGDDPAQLAAELETIEAALVRLAAAIERVDDDAGSEAGPGALRTPRRSSSTARPR
jgi:signal transduction histidine kinase